MAEDFTNGMAKSQQNNNGLGASQYDSNKTEIAYGQDPQQGYQQPQQGYQQPQQGYQQPQQDYQQGYQPDYQQPQQSYQQPQQEYYDNGYVYNNQPQQRYGIQRRVDFGEAIKMFVNRAFDFQGRSSRSEYWWVVLATGILGFAFQMIMSVMAMNDSYEAVMGITVVYLMVCLLIAIPSIALGVRRLHDIGKSGWNYLIAFIPLVGGIILLFYFIKESEPFTNEYGPEPNIEY